jgi:peptide deformylase
MNPASIVKVGDILLKKKADPVTHFGTKELDELIEYLFYNMKYHKGVGLAAPQMGESKKIIVYGFEKNPRYPDENPVEMTALINPEITGWSDEKNDYYEGCLSIPRIRGLVSRPVSIQYEAYTPAGKIIKAEARGFEARIIQHEVDHLNGMLFPMRMTDMSTLQYSED